jgi:hypothetical protein
MRWRLRSLGARPVIPGLKTTSLRQHFVKLLPKIAKLPIMRSGLFRSPKWFCVWMPKPLQKIAHAG